MTTNEVRLYLETCLNKHASGNALSPQELNILFEANIFDFVRSQVLASRQYVMSGAPSIDDTVYTALMLDSLQKSTTASLTGGSFTLPTDMLFLSNMYGTYSGDTRRIEVVSHEDYAKRIHNFMSKPIAYFPVAIIIGTACKVYPTTMTSLVVNYIAKPTIPIFDYYIDANYNIVYLAAAATRALSAGEYGSAGQTSTTVTSLTVELDIPEELHIKFADYILSKIAMRDRDQLLYQAVENEKSK